MSVSTPGSVAAAGVSAAAMEGLQGHINHIPCGEHMSLESWELEGLVDFHIYEISGMASDRPHSTPFPSMQLEEQNQQPDPSAEPSSFQHLLRLQEELTHQQQPQHQHPVLSSSSSRWTAQIDASARPQPLELESCVNCAPETLTETRDNHKQQQQQQQQHFPSRKRDPTAATTTPAATRAESTGERTRRKRSRPSACRNMKEREQQRRTHIAVERNRRKLMNDHLCSLRSLVPPSFIPRGDQASTVGGAIEYVKELEQLLLSLLAEKRMRALHGSSASASVSTAADASPFHGFFTSPQYTTYTSLRPSVSTPPLSSASSPSSSSSLRVVTADEEAAEGWCAGGGDGSGSVLTAVADIEATVVQTHVNLKVLSPRRPGQLLQAITALEDLHLSILHLNIATFGCTVLYTLNLKIEEECKLHSADEIATAVHQILSLVAFSCQHIH